MLPIKMSFLASLLALSSCSLAAEQVADQVAPERATALAQLERGASAEKFMVVAANPLAAQAGYEVLQAGGHAMDAMVAVQAMLGLVEPQSSGLGGGAFLVYWDAAEQRLITFDARETAPGAVNYDLFKDAQGNTLKFYDAVVGGRSVGVPGTPKLMYELHQRYGTQPWERLLQPAIELAEVGFEVSPRLADAIKNDEDRLKRYPDTAAYFFQADGSPYEAGAKLVNPGYAATLKRFSQEGDAPFYRGEIAQAIVSKVRSIEDNPGFLELTDLQSYRIKERPPVCVEYRVYEVCGMGPPSSGALTLGQILGVLNPFDLSTLGPENPESWRLIGEASRLAFADRGRYMADPDFVPLPVGLLDHDYLQSRAALIPAEGVLESVSPGEPRWDRDLAYQYADDDALELPSTSHFSIIDAQGNIVSMTTTIENGFGSRVMAEGFLLNNELTDFSFSSHRDGYPVANRVEPGKRPRSSMAPTIVFKKGEPYLAIGSPGGSRIIGYVANALIAHIDWGLPIQDAIEQPHRVNRFGTYDLELGVHSDGLAEELESIGYKVNRRDLNSGIHAVLIRPDGTLEGGADPRREGIALGD